MHTIPVTAVSWTLANISGNWSYHSGTSQVVKPSIFLPVVLIHNGTISITTGFACSPRKHSYGSIDFAVIAYPPPFSRLAIFLQADEILNCLHTLDSVFQKDPLLRTFDRNKITTSFFAMSSAFFPIKWHDLRSVFINCVT